MHHVLQQLSWSVPTILKAPALVKQRHCRLGDAAAHFYAHSSTVITRKTRRARRRRPDTAIYSSAPATGPAGIDTDHLEGADGSTGGGAAAADGGGGGADVLIQPASVDEGAAVPAVHPDVASRVTRASVLAAVTEKKLAGWIITDLDAHGVDADPDLVTYVLGVLVHPDMTSPVAVCTELREFLGAVTAKVQTHIALQLFRCFQHAGALQLQLRSSRCAVRSLCLGDLSSA